MYERLNEILEIYFKELDEQFEEKYAQYLEEKKKLKGVKVKK